ncbi:hypothetical protein F2P81_016206 [Scophthalmus maximus]|uniref:Uncharacterized protein n=1 Tax=Scophthalmus maximus TaxID=52904 RepID=A0A6A4SKJ1_SCOMX|nr:hypothetical protein F2P81_016206 [Scophthalmus maximus]
MSLRERRPAAKRRSGSGGTKEKPPPLQCKVAHAVTGVLNYRKNLLVMTYTVTHTVAMLTYSFMRRVNDYIYIKSSCLHDMHANFQGLTRASAVGGVWFLRPEYRSDILPFTLPEQYCRYDIPGRRSCSTTLWWQVSAALQRQRLVSQRLIYTGAEQKNTTGDNVPHSGRVFVCGLRAPVCRLVVFKWFISPLPRKNRVYAVELSEGVV